MESNIPTDNENTPKIHTLRQRKLFQNDLKDNKKIT